MVASATPARALPITFLSCIAVAVLGTLAVPAAAAPGWTVDCGTQDRPPCTVSTAKFESKQGLCPTGQFFDLIDGGTCWSCPPGTGRTIFRVDGDSACEKVATTDFKRAIERDKATGWFGTSCPGGQFWDIVDGKCHSCPDGYAMMIFEHVHGDRKCARTIPNAFSRAQRHGPPCGARDKGWRGWDPRNGGECWSCPDDFERTIAPVTSGYACEYKGFLGATGLTGCRGDLRSIRGTCRRSGECGKANQRPCEIGERLPSCDQGLKEDFKQNLCVPLAKGETPFTGGLSSVGGYLGAKLQAECKSLLGSIDLPGETNLGVGVRCGRDVGAGFACAAARDIATGVPDLVNGLMEKAPATASLADQMNAAANLPPCKQLGETFAKATRYAKATGAVLKTDCPAGQFWDPDGWCYSCPKDYARTFYPVGSDRACTDKIAGQLRKFACGAWEGLVKNFTGPLKCTIETLENGSIFDRPIDLKKADQVQCMATGEVGYFVVRTGIAAGKAVATGDVSDILSTIGKLKSAAVTASDLKRLTDCAKQR